MQPRAFFSAFILGSLVVTLAPGGAWSKQTGDPFVDRVVSFTPGDPHAPDFADADAALGPPDFNQSSLTGWVTLGVGGRITLEFVNNQVIDGPGADLKIYGDPSNDELWEVELSSDGRSYLSLGLLKEVLGIDLSEVGLESVRFVRLTDDGSSAAGLSPGAELDAVEALHSGALDGSPPSPTRPAPPAATPVAQAPATMTWIRTGGPLGGLGYDVRMRPGQPDLMYVTDAFAGVHISRDGGQSWTPSNTGIVTRVGESGDAIPVFSLTIDPNDPDIIWVGTQFQRGIFRSTDGGRTWGKRDSGIVESEGITFRGFSVQPGNSNVVYAAAEISSWAWSGGERQGREFDMTQGVVYKTTDGGQRWRVVWRGDNLARYIWIDPRDPNVLYLSTGIFDREAANSNPDTAEPGGEGVLKSVDGGETWSNVNNGLGNLYVGSLFMHPENPDILLAGTGNNQYSTDAGVYLTTNGGQTWAHVLDSEVVTSVEFSTSDPSLAYAAGAGSVYRSQDGGRTWRRVSGGEATEGWGSPGVRAGFPIDFQVDPDNPDRLFANEYGGGNFLSLDGGQSWEVASTGYTGAQTRALAVDPSAPGRVFAAARSGIFVSFNGGTEWTGLNYPPSRAMEWNVVAIDPSNPQHVLASNNWLSDILASTDGGQTWRQTGSRLAGERAGWRTIVFAPSNPEIVYAGSGGFFSAGGFGLTRPGLGIRRSLDGGKTWQGVNTALTQDAHVAALAVGFDNPNRVIAAAPGKGILVTSDGGSTWETANNGLRSMAAISIAVHPGGGEFLLAGFSRAGVYRSTDGGQSWKSSSAGLPPESSISSIVFDPTNPDIVYASDLHSGVYRSQDSGRSWQLVSQGLRTRSVNSLALSADGLHLYAATEGEGVFRLDLNGRPPAAVSEPPGQAPVATSAPPASTPRPVAAASPTSAAPPEPQSGLRCTGAILPWALLGPGFAVWRKRKASISGRNRNRN
ncbi:MAG TPA: hypothetical protein VFI11_07550 [Anaerolineales bacterium]|nr:hypothetical protein [Anaerolineales bacterium]